MYQNRTIQPMFKVNVKCDPKRRVDNIEKVEVQDFKLPPHGHSKDEDFDPTVHLELEEEQVDGEKDQDGENHEEDDKMSYDSDGNPKIKKVKVWRQVAPTLYLTWLFISPDKKMILTKL